VINWTVTLVNMQAPFEEKKVLVHANTVVEAFDEKNHGHPTYFCKSACYHSTGRDAFQMAQEAKGRV